MTDAPSDAPSGGPRARPAEAGAWTPVPGTRPGDAVYGAIVSAATVGAVGIHVSTNARLIAVWAFVVLTYWLAHVYVHVFSHQLDGVRLPLRRRFRDAVGGELGVVVGALPGLAVVACVATFGGEPATAATVTLGVTVGLLFGIGVFGAHRLGARPTVAIAEGLLASTLGIVMVLAKALLH